jgi:DNA topoisomerase-2
LTGIAKLDDANHAGTAKSKDCTLIITEGDSAKSLAMSGLSVVGRDYYGGKFQVIVSFCTFCCLYEHLL